MATIEIIVHPEWDLTEKVVVGDLTTRDIEQELDRFYAGPITKHVLWDLSCATFESISAGDVAKISAKVGHLVKPRLGGGGKSAIVSTSGLGFGMSRMYQAYREVGQEELPYMTFATRQEAIDWLLADSP